MQRGLFVIGCAVLLFAVSTPGVLAYPPPAGRQPSSLFEELVAPDDSFHQAASWGSKGLFVLGVVLVALAFNEQLKRGHHAQREATRPAKRRETSGRMNLGGPAAEAERRGDYAHAAALFDGMQDWKAATRCYGKAARLATPGSQERTAYLQTYAQRAFVAGEATAAVDLLVELGDLRSAAELKGKLGEPAAQAELLAKAGDAAGAAGVLERAGDIPGAARVLEASGDVEGAIALLGPANPHGAAHIAEAHGDFRRAAEIYAHAGESELAAPLFLRAGDTARAAEVFREGGDLPAAAEQLAIGGALAEAADLWLEVGQLDKAAQAFQKLGDPAGLARALEKRGDHLGAVRAFLQFGRADEALRVANAMTAEQRDAPSVRLLLGAAQLKLGKIADAIASVRPILARGGSDVRARCESFYLLGLAYQQAQDQTQAVACFEQCLALDHSFRDVPLRLSQLRAGPQGTVLSQQRGGDTPSRASTPPSGSSILPQRYLLLAKIGEGAMGTVYKAKDSVLDRPVAIKVLNRSLSENETARSYFLREARSAAAMSHPHIVTVFDAGFEGAVLYLVMEYLEGEDLETLATAPPGGLPEKTALRYAAQVADALAAVHAQNIVHRDVKPGNVMRLRGGEKVKLMDFGIAHLGAEAGKRKSTNVAGTPDFMAPEQLLGQGLGPWTDVYALGGTLYELLTGQVPFPEGDATLHAHQTPPPDPRKLKPGISAATAELVLSCLSKEPRERPQSAAALRDRLEKLAAS